MASERERGGGDREGAREGKSQNASIELQRFCDFLDVLSRTGETVEGAAVEEEVGGRSGREGWRGGAG